MTIGFFGAGASVVSASTRHSRAGPLAVNTACAVGSTAGSPSATTSGKRAAQSGALARSLTRRFAPSGPSASVKIASSPMAVVP